MSDLLIREFVEQSLYRITENTPRIELCLSQLSEEEIWKRYNNSSNSIGNIILHLCGNIRQYIISALGNKHDIRERDKEFSAQGGFSKEQLLKKLTDTLNEAQLIIKDIDEKSLLKTHFVQGFQMSGTGIIVHVTEHYSYHTGQIAFWTKLLRNKDLGFYANVDLNVKNEA